MTAALHRERRPPVTVWLERVVLRGAGGETLEVRARVYPDAGIVVLEEVSSDGSLSIVADVGLKVTKLEFADKYAHHPVHHTNLERLTRQTSAAQSCPRRTCHTG